MSEATSKQPSSPPRPIHQISRSISEVSPPTLKLHRPHHHAHHHHHPHLNSRRARSSDKHQDKEREPQSAHPNLQLFLHGEQEKGWKEKDITQARSEGVTPAGSRDASRRTSVLGAWESDGVPSVHGGIVGGIQYPGRERRIVTEGEVKAEREKGVLRATELQNSMVNLITLSNDTTRRLDLTYYSVLEKLSTLQSSITSLKELAAMSRTLNDDFKTEAEEVVTEISAQLEGFENFDDQEQRIHALQERIHNGREKITSLAGRVDAVKLKVASWERAEVHWQDKTRRRLKILWIVISVVATLLLGLIVFRYTPANPPAHGVRDFNSTELAGKIPDFEAMRNGSLASKKKNGTILETLRQSQGERPKEDPRLRALDEL